MTEEEGIRREQLGIPPEAERVIVFAESSHWDPNWLLTSEQYYERRIRHILNAAIQALKEEPRRVFSIECIFFLKMFWERNPDRQDILRDLINQGRMRLSGTGMTTPDTVLPDTEALIRDYLIGQEWLRQNKMTQEPRTAYLTDDFGYSPTVPDVFSALGYDRVVVTRVDGMYFVATDLRPSWLFPRPGSSAELLGKDLKTLDFVWRGPGGARVLCHWNAFSYFQGDMIALSGIIRWMGRNVGLPARSPGKVAKKIDSYVRQLSPLSPTPYMFCPIGCDFVDPIPDLVALLDEYNRTRYQDTGVYVVNAGLDDYMELVSCHKDNLYELELDMNPYWMGFYSARPEIKKRCKRLSQDLILGEKLLSAIDDDTAETLDAERELDRAWETLAVSNHHDFITGTSPDKVWEEEQRPWLVTAQGQAQSVINKACAWHAVSSPSTKKARAPSWNLADGKLIVESPYYRIRLDEDIGGCMTQWADPLSGASLLTGPGNDIVSYKDTGGLWRMGHEYWGGTFKAREKASQLPARLEVAERDGFLEATVRSEFSGREMVRRIFFKNDSPVVRMSLTGSCPKRTTVTCRYLAGLQDLGLTMDVPGGVVRRPFTKIYDPTFWPAINFVHLKDHASGRGMALFLGGPASVSGNRNGVVEWIALRNTPREKAFGFLPLLAHPASGTASEAFTFDYAVLFTPKGDWCENSLYSLGQEVLSDAWIRPDTPDVKKAADSLFRVDREDVFVTALKKASRGKGLIARLLCYSEVPCEVRLTYRDRLITKAVLCDARERDEEDVEVESGEAVVTIERAITTVRLFV
jgi:hypothetical protein